MWVEERKRGGRRGRAVRRTRKDVGEAPQEGGEALRLGLGEEGEHGGGREGLGRGGAGDGAGRAGEGSRGR